MARVLLHKPEWGGDPRSTATKQTNPSESDREEVGRIRRDRKLLIVEPNHLLRWSLVTYLGRWFHVFPVGSPTEAKAVLSKEQIDAVVVSDELGTGKADGVERRALARNPMTTVVHVVMSVRGDVAEPGTRLVIEKPFELATLARMLGVPTGLSFPRSFE